MWTIWDKQTEINGFSAKWFFDNHEFLRDEETIYIKTENGRVTAVEGKSILAKHYGLDPALPDEEFIAEYERMTAEPDPETDTTTYAELAQVYREGVNTIDE